MVDFGGTELAGPTDGMVRGPVWKAGKRVEGLLDVCFGGGFTGCRNASGDSVATQPTSLQRGGSKCTLLTASPATARIGVSG
jgi:hypothetical protein